MVVAHLGSDGIERILCEFPYAYSGQRQVERATDKRPMAREQERRPLAAKEVCGEWFQQPRYEGELVESGKESRAGKREGHQIRKSCRERV